MMTRRGTGQAGGSGIALAQMANANLNPWTESKVDTKNPDRGPLLILDGEKDHTVPWAIANASYKRQKRNPSVTEIKKMPNRGHSLTIDHGWQEVAQTALDFVKRFVPASSNSAPNGQSPSASDHSALMGGNRIAVFFEIRHERSTGEPVAVVVPTRNTTFRVPIAPQFTRPAANGVPGSPVWRTACFHHSALHWP